MPASKSASLDSNIDSSSPSSSEEPVQQHSVQTALSVKESQQSSSAGIIKTAAVDQTDQANYDIKFNFELLRIRSKQLRNSINFNSILFFILFVLFLFIILLHYRYSSPHYSIFAFTTNAWRAIFTRSKSHRPVYNSSLAERIDLAHLFESNSRRNRKFEKNGFNRLPQNETDAIDQIDDDDDLSDVIEDFSPKGSSSKTRLV